MRDLNGFDRHLVAVRLEVGTRDFGGPGVGQGPNHGRRAGFVEQADGERHAIDGIYLDLVEPVPELIIRFEHALLHGDITGLLDTGHLDHRKFRAVAVTVSDGLGLDIEAADTWIGSR